MDFADFGRYLAQQRELRGLSPKDVARATKIPPTIITALESGQAERMPGRVFVLNYIRAYAQVIGLQPEEAVLRFEEIDSTLPTSPPPPALERERRRRAWLTLVAVLVALGLAGYGALTALRRPLAASPTSERR
ncbi:MAG: helix-turn-helix domain-containing protein [Myxococcota bacterium]